MNPFAIPGYQLYLLQLENYELLRFFKLVLKKGIFKKFSLRKDLVWTLKARVIFILATTLHLMGSVEILKNLPFQPIVNLFIFIIVLLVLYYFYFLFYSFFVCILYPIDWLVKKIIVSRASSFITHHTAHLKIIGVAGSYGKTTIKEMLSRVLSIKYKVLCTPDSVNTPVGISRFILQNVSEETQILILEMGEHYKGDVKEICAIAKPDIAVITGINESHLERMGSLQNIVETIFEVAQNSKINATVLLNGDDVNVIKNYNQFVLKQQKTLIYEKKDTVAAQFDQARLGWEIEYKNIGKVFVKLLGEYAVANINGLIKVATELGLNPEQIKMGIETISPVSHRLEPIAGAGGVLIIDDAYNGNPEGVSEAIKVLSRFTNRRKVFITPGLVEMGSATAEVHREIGKELAGVADVVVLIKNSVTPWIEEGIRNAVIATSVGGEAVSNKERLPRSSDALGARNDKAQIIWFNTAQEAHASLGKILQPNDVVVFQNDWGDQYI
jgi:UDP-N-acetylmuramoyl-tripeptide--D-alanyl-D-alanine ligase